MVRCAGLMFAIVLLCPPADALLAGAAVVDITPPLGTPLNGYGYRLGRGATEVHDPVTVRCLYLESSETRLFLVTSDLCVLNRELRDRVLELAPPEVPPEHIILTATHNHSAQGGMSRALAARMVSGRFVPEVLEATARSFAESMRLALKNTRRATIGYGTTNQTTLSKHRSHPYGPIDPQIGVIRVDDSDGRAIAIVANFAAHPTTIGEEFALAISADYPGYFYKALEDLSDTGAVALFLNGAQGNQACANPESKTGWEHTESIGRLLALRTKALANTIRCGEAKLTVGYATPRLPLSIASDTLPDTTIVQTLEINDLLLTFFPGEPTVEIGLALRKRALARGYRIQFTVGLANDHLMYFVPREFYAHEHYEAAMNFYGPSIAEWFYAEFEKLMTRGELEPPSDTITLPASTPISGATHVSLKGTPYEIGYQRGLLFRESIRDAYDRKVLARTRNRDIIPETGLWTLAPPFVDLTPFALPRMAIGARPFLDGLSDSTLDEIQGMADAVELPFDALWLLQCTTGYLLPEQLEGLYAAPFCTMFAFTDSEAKAQPMIVGRTLDWPEAEEPVLIEIRPESGHAYIHVGFPWNSGVFTGMNDAGVIVCAERVEGLGLPSFDAPPIEFVLKEILSTADSVDRATRLLQSFYQLRGYHVLVADAKKAVVLELGEGTVTRTTQSGLLLGATPDAEHLTPDAHSRYARVRTLLHNRETRTVKDAIRVLTDRIGRAEGMARILNPFTQHIVVFEPESLRMHLAFPDDSDTPVSFTTYTLQESRP